MVPVGGGGLISGVAVALKSLKPTVRVVGVESEAAPSARASRDAGRIVQVETTDTIAEGIAVKRPGELTFSHIERWVDDLVVVSEEATGPLATAARRIPADVVAVVAPAQADAFALAGFSLFEGKVAQGGLDTAYDCRDFACRLPVTDPAALTR